MSCFLEVPSGYLSILYEVIVNKKYLQHKYWKTELFATEDITCVMTHEFEWDDCIYNLVVTRYNLYKYTYAILIDTGDNKYEFDIFEAEPVYTKDTALIDMLKMTVSDRKTEQRGIFTLYSTGRNPNGITVKRN